MKREILFRTQSGNLAGSYQLRMKKGTIEDERRSGGSGDERRGGWFIVLIMSPTSRLVIKCRHRSIPWFHRIRFVLSGVEGVPDSRPYLNPIHKLSLITFLASPSNLGVFQSIISTLGIIWYRRTLLGACCSNWEKVPRKFPMIF